MNDLRQDISYAVRTFRKSPGFTLAAVLSLLIGIGANTTIFSVTSALLLRPLPYRDAERLVILWNRSPGLNITEDWFSTAQYFDIRDYNRSFDDVAIAIGGVENLTGNGEPERVGAIHVSSNLLNMLGAHAYLGRLFVPEEDHEGAATTAVLNFGTWQRRYGGDAKAIGQSVTLNGRSYQIVGVMPRSFRLPREVMPTLNGAEDAEVLLPLPLAAAAANVRTHEDYNIMAKLKHGVTAREAQADMDTLTARLRRDFPDVYPPNGGLTFGVVPLLEQVVGDVRKPLWILFGAVGFVLLIACANVANLLLSRAMAREREFAIRAALGASRGRLVRQLLTENVLLAVLAGSVASVLALAAVKWIQVAGSKRIPRLNEISVNGEVLAYTLALSVAAGILFGLAPVLKLWRNDVKAAIHQGVRASGATLWARGNYARRLLVMAELALSVVLLIGSGLLVRSFLRLQKVAPGFNPQNVLTLQVMMAGRQYSKPDAVLEGYRKIWERLSHVPGVSAAGAVSSLPLSQMFAWGPITPEGWTPPPGEQFINADIRVPAAQYFEAMQIPLLSGRLFNEQDTLDKPRVALVDEYMAQQLWPGQDAIGKRFHYGGVTQSKAAWITVVGVVGRVKQYTLDADSRIALYLPHTQYPTREMNIVLRSEIAPSSLVPAVRGAMREIDRDLPLYNVRTMEERVSESLARQRFSMMLMMIFAAVALGLATIGTYGVISYLVNQGTREIGIRIALGATPRMILKLIVSRGALLGASGVALGVVGALALSRLMTSLLFGVTATDALTFGSIALLLTVISVLATYVPARRAAKMDPVEALRYE